MLISKWGSNCWSEEQKHRLVFCLGNGKKEDTSDTLLSAGLDSVWHKVSDWGILILEYNSCVAGEI